MDRPRQADYIHADASTAKNFFHVAAADDTPTSPVDKAYNRLGYGMRPVRLVLAELQVETTAHFRGTETSVDGFLAEKRASIMREM